MNSSPNPKKRQKPTPPPDPNQCPISTPPPDNQTPGVPNQISPNPHRNVSFTPETSPGTDEPNSFHLVPNEGPVQRVPLSPIKSSHLPQVIPMKHMKGICHQNV